MSSIILAVCGMPGSGKSTVSEIFRSKGFEYIHLGSTEESLKRFGDSTEEHEQLIREEMRAQHGMAAMAVLAYDKIKRLYDEGKNVVIDNMYSWSEYKFLKEKFGKHFRTIAVHASPEIRYERLQDRPERPLDHDTAISRDYSEIEELEKGGPIAMAEFNVVNEGGEGELLEQIEKVYMKIMNYK